MIEVRSGWAATADEFARQMGNARVSTIMIAGNPSTFALCFI